MSQFVEVMDFSLTVDDQTVDTVHNLQQLKIRLEYKGGLNGISAGDYILLEIDNNANEILNLIGYGHNTIHIFGDGDIGVVGTRTYRNDPSGNFFLEVNFNDGYKNYYGEMPGNITGWLETSVYILYKKWVQQETSTKIEAIVNGVKVYIIVDAEEGGGPVPDRPDTPGPIIGKSGRYGTHSGNLWDWPEVEENDYQNFEPIRWSLSVGHQNLTWRDLRGSNGESYYTTTSSLNYSNTHPTDERYQSARESYLMPYALQQGYPIDAPFHYENCVLEDYLVIGRFGTVISSAHDYVRDSLRIIRVMGREKNNDWWGKDAFRVIADSNFLKPGEPIDRYLPHLYFDGHRGLTINEFLQQMQSEGQFLDKTADDILTFAYVNNGDAPGSPNPGDTSQIPHFKLLLGDFHFNNQERTIDIIGYDNSVIFNNVPAKNLPFAYVVYYDTTATEAVLDHGSFHYNNSASLKFNDDVRTVSSVDLSIKLEDGSGGSGHTTELRIRKIDEEGVPLQGIRFTLVQNNVLPPRTREALTTINGTASFTIREGDYTLSEEATTGLTPLAPMNFSVENADELVNLKELLKDTDYADWDKLDYDGGINIITNHADEPPPPPPPPPPPYPPSPPRYDYCKEFKKLPFPFDMFYPPQKPEFEAKLKGEMPSDILPWYTSPFPQIHRPT